MCLMRCLLDVYIMKCKSVQILLSVPYHSSVFSTMDYNSSNVNLNSGREMVITLFHCFYVNLNSNR